MKKKIQLMGILGLLALSGCVIEEKDCDSPGGPGNRGGNDDDSFTPTDDDDDSSNGGSGLCWDFAVRFVDCSMQNNPTPDGAYGIAEKNCLDGLAAQTTQQDIDVANCGLECGVDYGECIYMEGGAYGLLSPDGSCPWCNDLLR